MATKSEQIFKLIEAGYSKAEIDAIMMDNEVNNTSAGDPSTGAGEVNSNVTSSNETTPAPTETKPTASDDVSNVALLTAITNLTKVIQESNRNTSTSDGNVNNVTESVTDILGKCLK